MKKEIDSKIENKFNNIKDELKEDIKKALENVEICFVHNIPSMAFNLPATIAINELTEELTDIKFVYWIHDSIVLRPQWKSYLDKWPFTQLHYENEYIKYITITKYRADQLRSLSKPYKIEDIEVIPNGINAEDYIKLDSVTLLLKKEVLDIEWEDLAILMPIRITPRKNIELGLKIVAELKGLLQNLHFEVIECENKCIRKPVRVKLIITGPPDNQATIEGRNYFQYIKDLRDELELQADVIFAYDFIAFNRRFKNGEIEKFSVSDAYALADLILITSKEEGFGLPIIEAGAAKKMIYCSRIPPFQELLREGMDGFMFELDDDPRLIAFRIYKSYLENTIDHNFSKVIRIYNWDIILNDTLMPLIRKLL
ncbi:MAG: glycosyltransferase [Candidatus Lokiarchaeota archaeon]|nr:glycosyltransferase [Candidatus Lokiarchaeota archaeon]